MSPTDHTPETVPGKPRSVWLDTTPETDYGPLDGDRSVDVAVVGGGIAGITTAYELQAAGRSVAVVERDRILEGVTGHTTAKLTALHGLIYARLRDDFGANDARRYAEANQSAIDRVESTAEALGIDCAFERAPAYTYTESVDDRDAIREEANVGSRLGLPSSFVESTGLPFEVEAAVRLDDQAHFHPRAYLLGLAEAIVDGEGHVFEQTRATDVSSGDPCRVVTDRGTVRADSVVVASHFPFDDPACYFARLVPRQSYVFAVRLGEAAPEGLYYRHGDPYFSVRPHPAGGERMALVGGQNHRTGHAERTTDRYLALADEARERLDVESFEYRWSTQDFRSVDGIPLVGTIAPRVDDVYVATGFGGWGMTNATVGAEIIVDRILGRRNDRAPVFRPTRFNLSASANALVDHNTHAMSHYFRDHLKAPPRADVRELEPGEGRVVETGDGPAAVHRDDDGQLHAVSAVCTHMGCLVEWNDGERSWDCPCHGSRFDADGSVIDTPAVDDLSPLERDR